MQRNIINHATHRTVATPASDHPIKLVWHPIIPYRWRHMKNNSFLGLGIASPLWVHRRYRTSRFPVPWWSHMFVARLRWQSPLENCSTKENKTLISRLIPQLHYPYANINTFILLTIPILFKTQPTKEGASPFSKGIKPNLTRQIKYYVL